jgi:hypothetical protein
MGADHINLHITRLQLFREVQKEFNRVYPFLQLEFLYKPDNSRINAYPDGDSHTQAVDLLEKDIGLCDEMTVTELENALQEWFSSRITVLRKSGALWMSTHNAEDWTLRKHNDQGHEAVPEFK